MKRILPFKALRYNKNVVGNLSAVLAPPYDIISEQMQQKLYSNHPFNVVRLEYGMTNEGDSETDNRYVRSAETLTEWMHSGVLVPDRQPSLYIYGQEFEFPDGRQLFCKGIICLVRLDEFEKGMVLPHEETLSKAKSDRFNLMMECGANFSPVYSLYRDESNSLSPLISDLLKSEADVSIKTDDGVLQKLWQITDSDIISKITDVLEDKPFFIADGHHRYETAINYRNAMREQNPDHTGNELYNYVMMYLADMDDRGLVVCPTHRMVKNVVGYSEQGVISQLEEAFRVEKIFAEDLTDSIRQKLELNSDMPCFAMHTGKNYYYLLKLRDYLFTDEANKDKSKTLRRLDVTVLHSLIFSKVLGVTDADLRNQTYLSYTRDISEAVKEVQNGAFQCSFILNPTKIGQIKDISLAGEKMPQKSTYFYPKLITGLVMNKIN